MGRDDLIDLGLLALAGSAIALLVHLTRQARR